jgi:RNA polymerase sigma-70 factor (ECF subfamily)
MAASWEATDWRQILGYYDLLVGRSSSPVAALNRAAAVAMLDGPAAGLRELDALSGLERYHLRSALRGELLRQLDRPEEAATEFELALKLGGSEPERRLLLAKLAACRA